MKKLEVKDELPDGRRFCHKGKHYKGASFFSTKEWNKKKARGCYACRKEHNKEQEKKHSNKAPAADWQFNDFSFKK